MLFSTFCLMKLNVVDPFRISMNSNPGFKLKSSNSFRSSIPSLGNSGGKLLNQFLIHGVIPKSLGYNILI
jgi:hypothetical protein